MKTKRKVLIKPKKGSFRVAIFGSARIKKTHSVYKTVYKLSKSFAQEGIDVVTGGGPGLMEAANSGHKAGSMKTKAQSIGLGIKLPNEQGFNDSLDYEETFMRFTQRLDKFMLLSNAVIVAPGGVGTILELFYTWQLVQVNHVCNIPIILLGEDWQGLIDWLEEHPLKSKYFNKEDLELLYIAKNTDEVLEIIKRSHEEFKKGNKDFCFNYDKYKARFNTQKNKKKSY